MIAKLLKSMTVNGKVLSAGTVVDVSDWRNAKSLENMRYIAFIYEEKPKAEKPKVAKEEIQEISLS